jgi:hypothetical protein
MTTTPPKTTILLLSSITYYLMTKKKNSFSLEQKELEQRSLTLSREQKERRLDRDLREHGSFGGATASSMRHLA